jgi:hypothetical protein
MSDRKSIKEWCDWLRHDLTYRAPELWPNAIEYWLNKTVRDYSLPEEQWVVVEVSTTGDIIRVYSSPEPMDRAAAFRLHRRLARVSSPVAVKHHCRKVELRNPDDYRRPDPQ